MKKLLLFCLALVLAAFAFATNYTIGTGTSSTSYSPFYGLYDYGWNKIIYTAAEINTAGLTGPANIHGLGFYAYNTPANYVMMDQKVYVRHTALASYGTATDETGTGYPASAGFTQVFNADVVYNGLGWYYLMFTTPFTWNGTSNLEIFYENWDGDYYSGYPTHTYTATGSTYMTVYKYADNAYPTTVGTRTYNRPNLRIVTSPVDAAIPAVLVSPIDGGWATTDVSLVWNNAQGMASSYDVYFGTSSNPPMIGNQVDMVFTPTLSAGSTYYWKVVARNVNGAAASSSIWSFQTPTTNQLFESFENTTFPPVGWGNPGAFTRSTTTPYHLTAGAYKSTATAAMLYTPMLEITETSELSFMARAGATTGIGRIQVKYSEDGSVWSSIGDEIAMPTNSNWNHYSIDLSSLAGSNYYIGFENYSSTTAAAAIYIDYVFGPEFAALTPDPATLVYPADDGWAFSDGVLSWNAAATGGIPTSYDVYFGTTDPPSSIGNQTALTYTPTLAAGTTYYWQIVPINDSGDAENCPVWSFKTPSANQLAESFDATTFPPLGWTNVNGAWSRSTSTPFYGTASAYDYTAAATMLYTPLMGVTEQSELDFWARASVSTQIGRLQIKYSADGTTWNPVGAEIAMPANTDWNNYIVDLSSLAGANYYIGFEIYSSTTSSAYVYIDHVIGPEFASVVPGPPTLTAPADLATDVSELPTFSWTGPTTGGLPTGYNLYLDTVDGSTLFASDVSSPYTLTTPLAYNTTFYWTVKAINGAGTGDPAVVRSFTTRQDPTIYAMPWLEDFGTTGTTFPPTNWTRWTGLLAAEPVALTTTTSGWLQDDFANIVTDPTNKSAKTNIYGTTWKYWLITPPIQMPGTGYQLEFDLALTDYTNALPPDDPAGLSGVDDKFVVLISDGSTWSSANAVKVWDNDDLTTGGIYEVYNAVPHTGSHWILPLDSYTGIKYIAFYGESTVSNADNDFFVDNVLIRQTPAGAPNHVTLIAPVDGTVDIPKENVTLSWTPSLTGGTPAYYEVYVGVDPIDPGNDYYGEYFYETEGTTLNLSAQGDIDLGFDTTWYWAVLPYNSDGLAPDPDSPEFMVWNFTTAPDPTITSLPYEEYFDGVTAPALPYGWSAYINSTSTSAVVATYSSTTYAQSAPNSVRLYNPSDAAADLRLITPPIDLGRSLSQTKMKFYARSSTAGYPLLIGSVSATDESGVFNQIQSITLTATKTEYEVSFADYVGTDQYICFKHGLGGTGRTLYIDNVRLIELLANDLSATSITGPSFLNAGSSYDYTITVFNEGTSSQNSYSVNLMHGTSVIQSVNVTTPLDPGSTAQHTLSFTPTTGGVYDVFGKVILTGDSNAANDETTVKTLYVVDNTMELIAVGDDATTTSGYYVPISMYYKNGVTEELYFPDEMHLQSGTITALVYKNTFVTNLPNKPIKIWMAHTTVTDLSAGWLPAIDYTLVFDGTVDFPSGVNQIVIPLDTPFAYTGGTLATRFYRPMDTAFFSTSDKFYYTTNPAHTIRSRYLHADATAYDPMAPSAAGTTLGYFPNTTFVVQDAVMQTGAILSGYVYETGGTTPIPGATVTITDERYTTTTDANGFYEFTFWEAHTVNAVASKTDYYNSTPVTGIALTVGNTVSQNLYLQPLPNLTASGTVTSNDYPAGLVGATVKLYGYHNYETTTLIGGIFEIPNVKGNTAGSTYTYEVKKDGYTTVTGSITVYATPTYVMDTVNLVENLWPAYNLVAAHNAGAVDLVWDPAGEPDYLLFDFDEDNGDWVGSGYGDWEWTNAYTLTGYTDNDTSVGNPPTAPNSGTGLWGTKVLGDYSNSSAWSYLRKTVDLSGYISPVLNFWHYMNGYNTYDYGLIKVNGTTVWGSSAAAVFMPWQELTVSLAAYQGMTNVEISFEWYATSVVSYAGWYIDDIYIGPATRAQAAFGSRNGNRMFLDYDVYRFLAADEANPGSWTPVSSDIVNPLYTDNTFQYEPAGTYKWAVKANYSGALVSEPVISNSLGRVYDPQDIIATTLGANVVLNWTAQPGATYYKVYAADDPYGTFTYLGYSQTNSYTITAPVAAKKFYKVTAIADEALPGRTK